jgi:hypothetical protein
MKELSDEQIEKIIDILNKGISLPEDYRLSFINHFEQLKNFCGFYAKR